MKYVTQHAGMLVGHPTLVPRSPGIILTACTAALISSRLVSACWWGCRSSVVGRLNAMEVLVDATACEAVAVFDVRVSPAVSTPILWPAP